MIKCEICGKKYKNISNTHLKSKHSITVSEYKKKYGSVDVGPKVLPHLLSKDDKRYKKWRRSLKNRKSWNKGETKDSHPSLMKTSRTMKDKKIDNFKKWREEAKKKGLIPKKYKDFSQDKHTAFLLGLILGDGNIYKHKRTECLRIALGTDKPDLITFTEKIVEKVIDKKPYKYFFKNIAMCHVSLYQNKLSTRFRVPCGDKSKIEHRIPNWVWDNEDILIAYCRGLYEAEGSYNIHKPTYTYKFIFTNRNRSLLDIVDKSMQKLGFHPHRTFDTIQLSKKEEVKSAVKLLNFRNYQML